jgi:outer membrane immunogenic protein
MRVRASFQFEFERASPTGWIKGIARLQLIDQSKGRHMISRMIRPCFAAIALLTASFAAQAADLPSSYKAPAYVAPSYANWTGFYLGLNGGYGFGKSAWTSPALDLSPKGALFGVTGGYNFQTGTWVWGIEGDLDMSTMKASTACTFGTCETKDPWLSTVRGRLGYAGWANWLPYITGGAALGEIKADDTLGSAQKTRVGWTAGLGVEYALMTNWSVKLEYLYVDLGNMDCGGNCSPVTPDDVSFKTNLVRAGINYRF